MKHTSKQSLDDWCKFLEKNFSLDVAIPTLPVIIRLDGNNFSSYTKPLNKPFDEKFNELMVDTAKHLVKETNAVISFVQSDEITLVLYQADKNKEIYHNGKKQKILSKLTGVCVNFFNERRRELLPDHNKMANFDCRMYQTPTLADAANQILWRELDATKNSIQMLGQSHFSHKSLQGLHSGQIQNKLLIEKNVNWNDLPVKYKRGVYVRRDRVKTLFTTEEIENLPAKHRARTNPKLVTERTIIKTIEYPILKDITNKVDVLFYNDKPVLAYD